MRQRLDLAQFEVISQTLAAADLIYIIGSKRAFSLVSYVSLAFANLGVRNLALDNVGSTSFELLRCASTSDAVLAVSFTPYNSITPELAASAAQRGVPIVSLTDSAFSPLVPVSKAYVEVIEEGFSGFKSLSATLAVAMALVLRVEQRRAETALTRAIRRAAPRRAKSGGGLSRETIDRRRQPAFREDLRCGNGGSSASASNTCTWATSCARRMSIRTPRSRGCATTIEARMADAIANFSIPRERVSRDVAQCVREARPDLAILCPATARHAEVVEEVAALGVDILLEKPFAASLADADRILAAVKKSGVRLAVNWPLRWYPPHVTTKRLIDEGVIGDVIEVHFYDGNRGPLYHRADKVVVSDEEVRREKPTLVVVQQGRGRRQPARLSRLRRDARDLVHERRGADRGDRGRRSAGGARGRRAFDHHLPLRPRPLEARDALGHLHRSMDDAAAAQMRLRRRRLGRHDFELRLRARMSACRPAPSLSSTKFRLTN